MLLPCEVDESLQKICTIAELKKLLKEHDLKQSGSKPELIERLVTSDRRGIEKLASKREILKVSDEARRIIEEYLDAERERLAQYQQKSFNCLQDHKYREACRAVGAHRQKKVYFTELGANLSEPYDGSGDIERLEFIFKSKPRILLHLEESQLEQLRIAAGMSVLWGTKASDWLPNIFTSSLPSADIAANMLLCNARLNEEKEQLRSSPVDRVSEIRLERYRGLSICDLCDHAFGKVYKSVDEIP